MVTRKEIAERLGVSVSVVSRALNNSGYVQPEKRERILEVARELGYGQEPAALRGQRRDARRVLFCCGNIRNPFNVELYNGICEAAQVEDYGVLMATTTVLNRYISVVDGVIFANLGLACAGLTKAGKNVLFPAVTATFGEHMCLPRPISMVDCDLWAGTERLIQHLRRKGHRRIAMVSPYTIDADNTRGVAWRASMESFLGERVGDYYVVALEHSPVLAEHGNEIAYEGFFENGVYAAKRFVESGCDATAVLCFNEEMGLGFCREIQRLGLRVPEDLSVAAYDGTFMRYHYELPLTVLALHPGEMGQECFRTLRQMMATNRVRHARIQPTDILEGATVRDISEL